MLKPSGHATPLDAEHRFRTLLCEEGYAQPDRVAYDPEPGELTFIWHEPKIAIVIELSDDGPTDVRLGSDDSSATL
ncbi:MAG: hypothetical protein ACR2G3_11750 [Solirubrobacterales bacterium]